MPDPQALRKLAAWYRKFAERAGSPMIWQMRLDTAERWEAEAQRAEFHLPLSAHPSDARISHLVADFPSDR